MQKSRYSADRNVQAYYFVCDAPIAQIVSVVGDFNKWNPSLHRMEKTPGGTWSKRIELRHGHHRYAFMVDGDLRLDPRAMGITKDDRGRRVSLVPIS